VGRVGGRSEESFGSEFLILVRWKKGSRWRGWGEVEEEVSWMGRRWS
jgi:hypothetical protein